jgi:hypothetical protein
MARKPTTTATTSSSAAHAKVSVRYEWPVKAGQLRWRTRAAAKAGEPVFGLFYDGRWCGDVGYRPPRRGRCWWFKAFDGRNSLRAGDLAAAAADAKADLRAHVRALLRKGVRPH